MILAVPKLEHAIRRHFPVPAGAGRIQPDTLRRQIVHAQCALVQRRFKHRPGGIMTQQVQPDRQPIICEVTRPQRRTQNSLQHVRPARHPVLRLIQPVVALRQDVGQPTSQNAAGTETLPIAVGLEVLIHQLGQSQASRRGQQHRNVVDRFNRYGKCFGHADSLPHSANPT